MHGFRLQVDRCLLERLMRLEEQLHERVVGQGEAVSSVAETIRRARAGLSEANRPIGSFLFLGPTGVGKSELAKTLAQAPFGDEAAIVRIDMSEFQERHTVSRLVGAPPGYVGYEEAGQLTENVRRKPYSVLLLDEIEFGARSLRRTIQRRMDNELASMVLSGSLTPGERVVVGASEKADGGLTFDVVGAVKAPDEDRHET